MNIKFYETFFDSLPNTADENWKSSLYETLCELFTQPTHGDYPRWKNAVDQVPSIRVTHRDLNNAVIEIGNNHDLDNVQSDKLRNSLENLSPWRKGPFNLFGINIDAEWRSNQKWQRLQPYLPELKNKYVLDVGCGNGYYMLRMIGAGVKQAIGVDPNLLFLAQFFALTKNIQPSINAHILPLTFENIPRELNNFDCVFSMGVLYHRRKPLDHLNLLHQHTAPGGMVFVETLVVEESYSTELIPKDRYAGMRNVWGVPSPILVQAWLHECGFINCTLLDSHSTTIEEQRSTSWMPYHSLRNYLDPLDSSKTIEGYPAPRRAIFSAHRPPQ